MRWRWWGSRPIGASTTPSARPHAAVHDRDVPALHGARRELTGQRVVRARRLGDDEEARGVLVEAVDDARPPRAAHARDRGRVGERGGGERRVGVAGARMHDHAGGLVDHEHVVVLVHDRRARWAPGAASSGVRGGTSTSIALAALEPVRGLPRRAVDAHVTRRRSGPAAARGRRPARARPASDRGARPPRAGSTVSCAAATTAGCGARATARRAGGARRSASSDHADA